MIFCSGLEVRLRGVLGWRPGCCGAIGKSLARGSLRANVRSNFARARSSLTGAFAEKVACSECALESLETKLADVPRLLGAEGSCRKGSCWSFAPGAFRSAVASELTGLLLLLPLLLLLLLLPLLRCLPGAYRNGLLTEARASRKCGCDFWRALRSVAFVGGRRCCEALWLNESESPGDVDRRLEPTSLFSIEE